MGVYAGPANAWSNFTDQNRIDASTKAIIQDGLVLNLDAGASTSYPGTGTTWTDLSNSGNDGTLINGPTFDSSNGGSLTFDGINDSWVCSSRSVETEFQYYDAFTISAFCYITENTNEGFIVSNRITDSNGNPFSGWGLIHSYGSIMAFVGGYNNAYSWRRASTSTSTFNSLVYNKWCHIVFTNTGTAGQQKIYLNSIDSTNSASDDTSPPYTINYSSGYSRIHVGKDPTYPHYLQGNIAQVQIYNRVLSQEEIQRNFNATRTRFGV